MKATCGCSVFKPTNTVVITVLLMLISPFLWSLSGVTVLCIEGNGSITVEKQHFNGDIPFTQHAREKGRPPPLENKCNNTNHILLADICSANEACYNIDLEPPQFLHDIVHFSTGVSGNNVMSLVPSRNNSPPTNQVLASISTLVLLI